MESNDKTGIQKKSTKEDLIVPVTILAFLVCAWFVYIYQSRAWITTFEQVMSWIVNPTITYTPVQFEGLASAFLATIEVLLLGAVASLLLFPKEKSTAVRFVSVLGLGFGITGFVAIILGIFGSLNRLPLNATILLLSATFASIILYKQRGKERPPIKKFLKERLSIRRPVKLPPLNFWSLAYLAIGIIFLFCFYNALLTTIVHWDATVYHAVVSVIMYDYKGIPIIAGPSIGIEMSANFPPLFSALGAYFYIQIGAVEDIFLRAIPPIMGILTVIATYKIGDILAGKKYGLISALFLAMTPMFFRYSMYATSYSALAFFCTVSIMFLLLGITKKETRYWAACGLFYGFALLTSYIGLFLAPFFAVALAYYFALNRGHLGIAMKYALVLVLSALAIGSVWYVRNWVLLENPIYPNVYALLGGINIDPLIMETTINGIKYSGATSFFSGADTVLEKTFTFLVYRTYFPAISLFTLLGVALLPFYSKKLLLVSAWPFIATVIVLSGLTWAFPRHMVFALPGFALLSALPIAKALEKCEEYDRNRGLSGNTLARIRKLLPSLNGSYIIRIALALLLFGAFLFPTLTLSFGGKASMDNHHDLPSDDYLWLFRNPNGEKWSVITHVVPEGIGWKWMDEHLKEGEKVAAVENRIYHIKNSNNSYFFYLDGWEARELYNITDPAKMLQFLAEENVKYVLDVAWARTHGHFDILPMTQFFGSAYFPKIFDGSGNPDIYNVGPVENPITKDSVVIVSINQEGWSEPKWKDGRYAQSVIAGNDSARLLVATPALTSINMTYHDVGSDTLSINLYNPYSKEWIYGYETIQKNNTGGWKTFEFLAPVIDEGYAELALHSYKEDFTISRIVAEPFAATGRVTLNSLESEMTNMTVPPALMVYLPMVRNNETVFVQTDSYSKKVCVEIFEGVIQPREITGWWSQHELVTRSPNSTVYGQLNPSLVWNSTKSGLYTMVIVSREEGFEETNVTLQVSMGGRLGT